MDAKTKSLVNVLGHYPRGTMLFYADNTPGDFLIRLGSGSYWSHCAVALGNGQRIESWQGVGVRIMGGDFLQTPAFAARKCPVDPEILIASMQKQLGKPYDYLGWFANPLQNIFGFRMAGGPPDSFHCSSLIDFASAGAVSPRKPYRAVTPQDVYNWADAT